MTNDWPDYELLDFGDGRKLERMGPWILDRPCPTATREVANPAAWSAAHARYEADRAGDGSWDPTPSKWAAPERISL